MIKLTKQETLDLIHALLEWELKVGPHNYENEVGLNNERYILLMQKLIDSVKGTSSTTNLQNN